MYIWLLIRRLLVLLLGVILAWFTVFKVFPFVDDRTPLVFAVLITYCFLAYGGLPAMVRIWQLLHRPTRVPTRTHASDGWALDPINVVVVAKNQRQFVRAMQKAGWLVADNATLKNRLRFAYALVFNQPYPTAPFSNQYVFGRKQDLGFQIPVGSSPRDRHHVRFWRLGTTILDDHEHHTFWRRLLKGFLQKEKEIWVGAAVLDRGLNIRKRTLQLDHAIVSDTTVERDYLVTSLRKAGVLKDLVDIEAGEPLRTAHQGLGETIISDGFVKVCNIKRQFLPPLPTDKQLPD